MDTDLQIDTSGGICRITFTREAAFNAISEQMAVGLVGQLRAAVSDDEIRVVVITGTGMAFSAGADIEGDDPVERFDESTMEAAATIIRSIVELDKPVVAAVNGVAAGVGASICFAADLAICKQSATFILAFSQLGLMVDGGSSLTVAAAVGRSRAMRMALLAEPLGAQDAHDRGLVSHVVPDEEFGLLVDKVARRLAVGPPLAYAATKRAINAATLGGLEDALAREGRGQVVLFGTDDAAEGMRAFVQKRRPTFVGR